MPCAKAICHNNSTPTLSSDNFNKLEQDLVDADHFALATTGLTQ